MLEHPKGAGFQQMKDSGGFILKLIGDAAGKSELIEVVRIPQARDNGGHASSLIDDMQIIEMLHQNAPRLRADKMIRIYTWRAAENPEEFALGVRPGGSVIVESIGYETAKLSG